MVAENVKDKEHREQVIVLQKVTVHFHGRCGSQFGKEEEATQ